MALRHVGFAGEAYARIDLAELPETHRPYLSGHDAHPHRDAGKALFTLGRRGDERLYRWR